MRNITIGSERGAALVTVLVVLTLAGIIGTVTLSYATRGTAQATAAEDAQEAQEAAESGLQAGRAQISKEPNPKLYDGGTDDSEWSASKGGKTLNIGGANATTLIKIEHISNDEYRVMSSGKMGNGRRDLEAIGIAGTGALENWRPVASDDSGEGAPGENIVVNVLEKDSDPDGDVLRVVNWTQPEIGTVSCTGAGMCTYRGDTVGTYSYEYTIADPSGLTATATVIIEVATLVVDAPPKPPEARGDSYRIPRGESRVWQILDNDIPGDADSIVLAARSNPAGSLSCNTSGQCSYTPPAASTGIKNTSFFYDIKDANGPGNPARATVSIAIIDPPAPSDPPERSSFPDPVERCLNKDGAASVVGANGYKAYDGTIGGLDNAVARGTSGKDYIRLASSNSVVDGGGSSDIVFIAGDAGVVHGGPGNDVIVVGNAKAEIDGGGGDDLICVSSSDQVVIGGDGEDVIHVGGGRATLEGRANNDRLYKGAGDAVLDGGGGTDYGQKNGAGLVVYKSIERKG